MSTFQSHEDRAVIADVQDAYARSLTGTPKAASPRGPGGAGPIRLSRAQVDDGDGGIIVDSDPRDDGEEDEPLDWWIVISGALALALSVPVTRAAISHFDSVPALLWIWACYIPTFLVAIAIGWFLVRVPRPDFDGTALIGAVVTAPILLALGILGNVLTCGFGMPLVAVLVIVEANKARSMNEI